MNRSRLINLARAAAGVLLLCLAAASQAAPAPAWPQIALPPDASVYGVDSTTSVDGVPMRMQGFASPSSSAVVAQWFRRKLGQPLVENQLGNKLVLGQARGDYFITVQLEPVGSATRAIVAVAHVSGGFEHQSALDAANSRLLARLPAGTRIVSQLGSVDGPRSATYVVLANGYDERVNRDRLVRMLGDDGLRLEREVRADPAAPGTAANGVTLYFKGSAGSEAMAVIARGRDGQQTIVLNTTTVMEHYQ